MRKGLFMCLVLIQAAFAFNCGQNSSINSNSVSIAISPGDSGVSTDGTVQFSDRVSGTTQTAVTWSIEGSSANEGSINSTGLYKAPGTGLAGPITIEAKSTADTSATATALVWVIAPGKVSTTNNPMVAKYSITVPSGAQAKIEFGPDTSYGRDTWTQQTPVGGGPINILVAGMRAFTTYHMRADVALPGGVQFEDADHTFQTQGPPANRSPNISVSQPGNLSPNPGVEMLDLINYQITTNPLQAVVTDLQGHIIWYYDVDPDGTTGARPFPIKRMPNGDMLVNATPPGAGGKGGPGQLREIDLSGNIIRSMTTAQLNDRLAAAGFNLVVNAMHHDFAILPNGHLILIVNHLKDFTDLPGYPGTTAVYGDALVDLDQNWQPVWVWDTFDHLDINRHPRGLPDWTHSNAIIYSPDDGDLLLSMRHQSWIIKIDYQDGSGSGKILWRLGYQGDFTMASGGAPAAWQYGQHDINFISPTSAGIFDLAMFDNGFIRVLDNNGDLCGSTGQPACYSRGPIFRVDEYTKTVNVMWQDTNLPYSLAMGSERLLTNNDMEIDEAFLPGSPIQARVQEVTHESTPQVVWQMNEKGQSGYRIYRIPSLYPGVQW